MENYLRFFSLKCIKAQESTLRIVQSLNILHFPQFDLYFSHIDRKINYKKQIKYIKIYRLHDQQKKKKERKCLTLCFLFAQYNS